MTQAGRNESHWLPDICFGEDQSCVRIGITTGGGGAPSKTPEDRHPNIVADDASNHFCKIEIESRHLTFEVVNVGGTVIDTFTMSH